MKAQYKLIFARKGLDSQDKGLIQLLIYFDRAHRKYHSTGYRLHKSQWNARHNSVIVTDKHTAEIDAALREMIRKLEAWELSLIRKGEQLTPARVDEYFKAPPSESLNKFIQDEIDRDNRLKYGTTKMHAVMLKKLSTMQSDISFDQVNFELISRFDNFLTGSGLSVNTVADNHKMLRRYLNIAVKKSMITTNPYRTHFRLHREGVVRLSLSTDEIISLENLDLSASLKLSHVRDCFLFCCYTGLRWSDMAALVPEYIQSTPEGLELALHRMVKVPQPVFIPLHLLFNGKAETILRRYDMVLPVMTNQRSNGYLKDIIHLAGITKRVTWHTARHTFGSQLAARYNDPYLIMQLMGHSEIKTSMIYIHSSQEILKDKLRGVHW